MNQVHVLTFEIDNEVALLGAFTSPSKVATAIAEHRKSRKTDDHYGHTMKVVTHQEDANMTLYHIYPPGSGIAGEFYSSTIVQPDELVCHSVASPYEEEE